MKDGAEAELRDRIAALRAALGEACELGEPGGRMSPTKRNQKVLTAATTTW